MTKVSKISDLQKEIKSRIKDSLENEVFTRVQDVERKMIRKNVYKVYKPRKYSRRKDNGGLTDRNNIVKSMNREGNRLKVSNVTRRSKNMTQKYLTPLIIYGHKKSEQLGIGGYEYIVSGASYLQERDFIKATRKELESDKQHVKGLKAGMRRNGFKVK